MKHTFTNFSDSLSAYLFTLFIIFSPSISQATLYEDAEDGDISGNIPPNVRGWFIYDGTPAGAVISNVFDADKNSRVINLVGPGNTANGYMLGDWYSTSPGTWNNTTEFNVHWCAKYSTDYVVFLRVYTTLPNTSGSRQRYIYYTARNYNNGLSSSGYYIHHGIGTDKSDGQWHSLNRDLQADLSEFEPGNTITSVVAYLIRGTGRIDDIHLTQQPMKPVINLAKSVTTIYDPVNLTSNPKAIPGAVLEYSLTAKNTGFMQTDNNTTVIQDSISSNMKTCVANIGQCKKPYLDIPSNTSGMTLGTITYTIGGIDTTTPTADAQGYNTGVTAIKINMNGIFPDMCSGTHRFKVKFRTGVN
jgi:hypothetical protein